MWQTAWTIYIEDREAVLDNVVNRIRLCAVVFMGY